ncbi:MAG TPA: hypothetical protein VFJ30_18295 [Phycisphaerae bacterium]|nr:hypothetical protein [Phycisphaerae bacterium]
MRNNVRVACACLPAIVVAWQALAEDVPPTTQPARPAIVSEWSPPSAEGLQTRLVSITKAVRPGRPLFVRMEVRHKDGKDWARATTVLDYPAEVVVRDKDSHVVDSLSVRLGFRTMIPPGNRIVIGVFPAGKSSAALRAGTYRVSVESKVTTELVRRGAVQLPVAGPLSFQVPGKPASAPSGSPLQPDYEQAEELRLYLEAWRRGYPTQLVAQGQSVLPGLVALVERGDGRISEDSRLLLWQYAAFLIGEIGDSRAAPFLVKRIDDKEAMDFYFVQPLGTLGVKCAVPRLIRELQTMDDRGWEVISSAYGSRAAYLVKALEQITGQRFPAGERRWPEKKATLKAVTDWWAKQDATDYAKPETRPASESER